MLQRRLKTVTPCGCDRCVKWRKRKPRRHHDCPHCIAVAPTGTINAEPSCCGYGERHQHCPSCGWIRSVGDWDAKPIASFTIHL